MRREKMQQLKSPAMMLALASSAGLLALYGSPANGATSYTWTGTTGATQTWTDNTQWNPNNGVGNYPQNAGDAATLESAALTTATNWVVPSITVASISLSPATSTAATTLTATPTSSTLTFDNGASAAALTDAHTSTSLADVLTGFTINLNSNLTMSAAGTNGNTGALTITGGSINGGSNTITKSGTGRIRINNQATNTAALWKVTAGRLITNGSTVISGDITSSGGGIFINGNANATTTTCLFTDNGGTWNSQGNAQSLGALAGTSTSGQIGSFGAGDFFTLNGATTASSTTLAGYLGLAGGLTLAPSFAGHTQILGGTDVTKGNITGAVVVNGGTLQLDRTTGGGNYALARTATNSSYTATASSLKIGSTGLVQYLLSNQISPDTAVTLNGGTLNMNGNSQTVTTALAISAASVIDFGAANAGSVLAFGDSSAQTYTGLTSIDDWTGNLGGGGTDQLFLGSSADLTGAELSALQFVNPNGLVGDFAAIQLPSGEVVPSVPEPASLGLLTIASGILAMRRRKATR